MSQLPKSSLVLQTNKKNSGCSGLLQENVNSSRWRQMEKFLIVDLHGHVLFSKNNYEADFSSTGFLHKDSHAVELCDI